MNARHVIILCVDALRHDALSAAPDRRYLKRSGFEAIPDTPTLDRLAAEGTLFADTVSAATYTTTAHATLFTGLFPPRHGVRAFFRTPLSEYAATLAERLRGAGFATWHSDEFRYFPLFGLDRGVQRSFGGDDEALFKALDQGVPERLYLFAHFFDVHEPYGHAMHPVRPEDNAPFQRRLETLEAELGFRGRPGSSDPGSSDPGSSDPAAAGDALVRFAAVRQTLEASAEGRQRLFQMYLEGVNHFDRGRLARFVHELHRRGVLDDALLLVTGDHGEADTGASFGHSGPLLEEAIRVPLILRAPGAIRKGRVVRRQAGLVDVVPTVLEWCGLPPVDDPTFEAPQGRSLLAALNPRADQEKDDRVLYGEVWSEGESFFGNLAHFESCRRSGRLSPLAGGARLAQRYLRLPPWKLLIDGEAGENVNAAEDSDPAAFVTALYRRHLGRDPDPEGLAWHLGLLADGRADRPALDAALAVCDEARARRRLYDLSTAPAEWADGSTANGAGAEAAREKLLGALPEIEGPAVAATEASVLPAAPEDLDRLQQHLAGLGYIALSLPRRS